MQEKLILIFLAFFIVTNVRSQDSTLIKKVQELIEVSNVKKIYESRIESSMNEQRKIFTTRKDSILFKKYSDELIKQGFSIIEEDYKKLFQQKFTESEIEMLIDFYNSEVGKLALDKFPTIYVDLALIAEQNAGKIIDEINLEIQEENQMLFENDIPENCEKFRLGEFEYLIEGVYVKIIRTSEKQSEFAMGTEFTLEIEWNSNNKYTLTKNYESKNGVEAIIINATIYEVNGNTYKFIAKDSDLDEFTFGEITKIK